MIPALDGYYLGPDKQNPSYRNEIAMLLKKDVLGKLELDVTHCAILEGEAIIL